jgi:glycosyltransferase involved in cell wall biosynthesis
VPRQDELWDPRFAEDDRYSRDEPRANRKLDLRLHEHASGAARSHAKQGNTQSLTIAYVLPGVGISGGNNIVFEHASRLANRGYNVFLLNMYGSSDMSWHPASDVLKVFCLDDSKTFRFLANTSIDALFATGWQTFYEILRCDLRARHHFYFVQAQEALFSTRGSWEDRLADITLNAKINYVTEASWICNWLNRDYGHDVVKLPHKLNRHIISETEPLAPRGERLRVLLEGPLSNPWKRMGDAFLAVRNLDAEIWCVSGAGSLQPWQRPERFFHAVPYSMMNKIMSSCDILVKLSAVEGVFGPPLEMMACGGTAVTTRVNGYDEYIIDGYNALTVEVGDYDGARRVLKQMIEDRELLQLLKRGARETADRLSGWESTIDILENKILSVCSAPCEVRSVPIAGPLRTIFDLCLDVRFSRHNELPLENRANWQTTASYFGGVTCEGTSGLYCVLVRGWAFNSKNGQTYERFALQLGNVVVTPEGVSIEDRGDVYSIYGAGTLSSGYSFGVAMKTPIPIEQLGVNTGVSEPPPEDFSATILAGTSDRDLRPVQRPPGEPNTGLAEEVANLPVGHLDVAKVLPGWRFALAVDCDRWPTDQGDNYCPILQLRLNPMSVHYVLYLPDEPAGRTWLPAVSAIDVGDGSKIFEIDLHPIYRGVPRLDFVLFMDPQTKILDVTYRPGLLDVHHYV